MLAHYRIISKVSPPFFAVLKRTFLPWWFWASTSFIFFASSSFGVWGTKSGTSKPPLVNQFFFWSSFFFCLWSSFHVLLWLIGRPPFLFCFFVTLPLGYFQCDKYNHLLLKDEIWFLLFHSPRQTIFPGRLKSEIKSLTKTTTDLSSLSGG